MLRTCIVSTCLYVMLFAFTEEVCAFKAPLYSDPFSMDPILENGLVSAMKDEMGQGVFGLQV